jgi:uncharacterized protein (DUF697 family)
MKKTLGRSGAFAVLRELRRGTGGTGPVAVAGARELVPLLARELRAGGDASAVVEGVADGAAALVWVGPPDVDALRAASRASVPVVALTDADSIPYVFASGIVHVRPGQGFPVEEIARALARALGDNGASLAARLPVLREAVCDHLIASFARRNGLVAAAVFLPGVDRPLLTRNQIRLVLRIGSAHGAQSDKRRLFELLGVVGASFGLRAVARELVELTPVAGWAVRGAVAYTGTRAIGEAAVLYFAALPAEGTPRTAGPGGSHHP